MLISSVRNGKSHKVEVSISIIFAGDGRNSRSDRCALNDNVTKNSRRLLACQEWSSRHSVKGPE